MPSAPIFVSKVSAGFPSTADDLIDRSLNLHDYVVKRPAATYFLRVEGTSMVGAGIYHGDIVVVDRSLKPTDGAVVIASLDGDFTIKCLRYKDSRPCLYPENRKYPVLVVTDEQELEIWGVVTHSLHKIPS